MIVENFLEKRNEHSKSLRPQSNPSLQDDGQLWLSEQCHRGDCECQLLWCWHAKQFLLLKLDLFVAELSPLALQRNGTYPKLFLKSDLSAMCLIYLESSG